MASAIRITPLLRSHQTQALLQLPHTLRSTYATAAFFSPIPSRSLLFSAQLPALLPAIVLPSLPSLSSFLQELWNGILNAVPKKKQPKAQSKKRRNTGKGLRDVEGLVHCSSCGRVKRMHFLCPYCVQNIQDLNRGDSNLEETRTRLEEEQSELSSTKLDSEDVDPETISSQKRLREIRDALKLRSPVEMMREAAHVARNRNRKLMGPGMDVEVAAIGGRIGTTPEHVGKEILKKRAGKREGESEGTSEAREVRSRQRAMLNEVEPVPEPKQEVEKGQRAVL